MDPPPIVFELIHFEDSHYVVTGCKGEADPRNGQFDELVLGQEQQASIPIHR